MLTCGDSEKVLTVFRALAEKQAAMKKRIRRARRKCEHNRAVGKKGACSFCRRRKEGNGRLFVQQYLRDHPCVDCGESDVDVLEFDHRDPATKLCTVSNAGNIRKTKAEIAKCDVRCANCHARRHARERRANAVSKA